MSREQRRMDRRAQVKPTGGRAAGGPPSRRTPVKAPGGGGFPIVPIAVAAGTFAVVLLVVYLVLQSRGDDSADLSKPEREEQNSSADIAGTYVPSQGRGHFSYRYSTERAPTPFCDGVAWSGNPSGSASGSGAIASATAPSASDTPEASPTGEATAAGTGTAASTTTSGTPVSTATVPTNCYNSNPPSSGRHLNAQRNVDLGNGAIVNIPPDPDVYPSDVQVPREAIAHILEHAGVFVGYNCESGNTECEDAVADLEDLVNDRIDNHDDRVIMANDSDLVPNTIGVASWTRVYNVSAADYDRDAIEEFIGDNSCRIDWEGLCR